jgi:hypothetical protein
MCLNNPVTISCGLELIYRINSQGEVIFLNDAWELLELRWYDLKGAEIKTPSTGINIYRVQFRRGMEIRQASGKWVRE